MTMIANEKDMSFNPQALDMHLVVIIYHKHAMNPNWIEKHEFTQTHTQH